tara:strand:+ start:1526 stop:1750 length:225 start_codon:yes stop_codon:yes gene_type:complete
MIVKMKAEKQEGMPVPIGAAGLSMYLVTIACTTVRQGWKHVDSHEVYVLAGGETAAVARAGRMINRLHEGFRNV